MDLWFPPFTRKIGEVVTLLRDFRYHERKFYSKHSERRHCSG